MTPALPTSSHARAPARARLGALAFAAASAAFGQAQADEPMFGYVNTTDLLPKGKSQVEQWLTLRSGQAGGRYSRWEGRTEAEFGLSDNLQLTGYLNYDYVDAERNSPRGLTEGLGIRPGHPPLSPYSRGRFDGGTAELVWRVSSPYLRPVGFAVLAEGTLGPDERAERLRAILQKNFRDDTVILAANAWVELARRPAAAPNPVRPKVTTVEVDLGASYRFRANWSAALEYRWRTDYAGYGLGTPQYSAHFIGPTLHYGSQRWFATLAVQRQIHGAARTPSFLSQTADGLVFGARHTRWDGVRLRIGRTF